MKLIIGETGLDQGRHSYEEDAKQHFELCLIRVETQDIMKAFLLSYLLSKGKSNIVIKYFL